MKSTLVKVGNDTWPTPSKQALVVDLSCGNILFEKKAEERMFPSSMTKVLTAYLAFQAIHKGELRLKDTTTISRQASRFRQGSCMFLRDRQTVTVDDLLNGIIIASANDGCLALGEMMSGSQEAFVQEMNQTAKAIGMSQSHFVNASGWPDKNHWTTCYDLALLTQRTIEDFPQEYARYKIRKFTFNGITQPNLNPLLKEAGIDGVKTGFTDAAGYGMIASGVFPWVLKGKDEKGEDITYPFSQRIIFVINGLRSKQQRSREAKRMLDWIKRTFTPHCIARGKVPLKKLPVFKGSSPFLEIESPRDICLALEKGEARKMKVSLRYPSLITSPVKKGDVVGEILVSLPSKTLFFPLVARSDISMSAFRSLLSRSTSKST